MAGHGERTDFGDALVVPPAAGPFEATLEVPGDKSITHRAILLGAVAEGATVIERPLDAADTRSSVALARALGAEVETPPGGPWVVRPRPDGPAEPEDVIDCGNSGTTLRLSAGLLAGYDLFASLTGDASLRRRPMARVVEPLRRMGARIDGREGGRWAPLSIRGGRLRGIEWTSPVASAQVKSAILLAGLRARGRTAVTEPSASRDHTERMLAAFGARVARDEGPDGAVTVAVDGGARLRGQRVVVPGDISSAAFFFVAAAIVPGSAVTVRGVGVNPTRSGVLDALRMAGAQVELREERVVAGEPVADVTVRAPDGGLRPFEIAGGLVPRLVDEVPVLAVLALAAGGRSRFRDCGELRVKESDRLAVMAAQLSRLGADVEETPHGLVVRGGRRLSGGRVSACGDHRVAMALAVAGLLCREPVHVEGAGAVRISFPGFAASFAALRGEDQPV